MLSPDAEDLLLTLTKTKGVPLTPALDEAARALVQAGFAEQKQGRGKAAKASLVATDAGLAKKKEIQLARKPAKKAPAPRKPAAAKALSADDLVAFEERLLRRLEELIDRKLAALLQPAFQSPAPAPAPPPVDLGARLLELTAGLAVRHNPLVAIPDLRRALQDVTRGAFDAALLDLEARRKLYLKIANDPRAVPHPEDGLRIAERGLVYYAALPS